MAQLSVPITVMIAPAGQTAQPPRFLMNLILVKAPEGWKMSSVLPIPVLGIAGAPLTVLPLVNTLRSGAMMIW